MLEMMLAGKLTPPVTPGQVEYKVAGVYSWIVPENVSQISAVAIGTGSQTVVISGAAHYGQVGALRWLNNIPVTPGETLTITVTAPSAVLTGQSVNASPTQYPGGNTSIKRGSAVLLQAAGGQTSTGGKTAQAAACVNGSGGLGGFYAGGSSSGWPGGGTGGYYADGGGTTSSDSSAGIAGTITSAGVGSNGTGASLYGSNVTGTKYGYGGGASQAQTTPYYCTYNAPGIGAVRIIWGTNRSYPTAAANV